MQIKVDDVLLFELSNHQKQVMCNDIQAELFDEDMKRRLQWVIMHKYEQCMKRLREEWEPKLKQEGAESLPCNNEQFCSMVMAHKDYKDRSQRELERAAQ